MLTSAARMRKVRTAQTQEKKTQVLDNNNEKAMEIEYDADSDEL